MFLSFIASECNRLLGETTSSSGISGSSSLCTGDLTYTHTCYLAGACNFGFLPCLVGLCGLRSISRFNLKLSSYDRFEYLPISVAIELVVVTTVSSTSSSVSLMTDIVLFSNLVFFFGTSLAVRSTVSGWSTNKSASVKIICELTYLHPGPCQPSCSKPV
jgi:hypothetical protein